MEAERENSFADTLDRLAERQERGRVHLLDVASTLDSVATLVAWQVAVVSPGFLGLLWNASALVNNSRLPGRLPFATFMVAEGVFLVAIVSAVLVHAYLIEKRSHMVMAATLTLQAKHIAKDARNEGVSASIINRINELDGEIKDNRTKLSHVPRWTSAMLWLHPKLTVAGYVLMGILLAGHSP